MKLRLVKKQFKVFKIGIKHLERIEEYLKYCSCPQTLSSIRTNTKMDWNTLNESLKFMMNRKIVKSELKNDKTKYFLNLEYNIIDKDGSKLKD